MMQMIAAGGIEPMTDDFREPDADNPKGYLEFERVKQIRTDKSWLPDARGRAVKMVHLLLLDLPPEHEYRIIFMRRRPDEVLASQSKMLERQGKSGAALPPAVLAKVYQQQLDKVLTWAGQQPNLRLQEVWYHDVVARPAEAAAEVDEFLGGGLDTNAMAAAVDPSLYRNKA